jgi:hypothetical protein
VGQERLGPSYFFISLVLGPVNSLVWYVPSVRYTRGLGWRIHCGVEVPESSTNKQYHHHLSSQQQSESKCRPERGGSGGGAAQKEQPPGRAFSLIKKEGLGFREGFVLRKMTMWRGNPKPFPDPKP